MVFLLEAYCSVLGKHPLLDKHPCTTFQWRSVAAFIQMYVRVSRLKSGVMWHTVYPEM